MPNSKMKTASRRIERLINRALDIAVEAIECEARRIMKNNPRCASFAMGMGTACFYDKAGDSIGDYGPLPYPSYLKKFDDQINEWDTVLRVTGEPMKIVGYDGESIRN